MEKNKAHALLSWLFVAVLVCLCVTLSVLQYRWIGEASRAEHDRLRSGLQQRLIRLAQEFNNDISAACVALLPGTSSTNEEEIEQAYAARYVQWRNAGRHAGLFGRIFRAVPQEDGLVLRRLDLDRATFAPAEWPAAWNALRERLTARLSPGSPRGGPSFGPPPVPELAVIDLPRFVRPEPGAPPSFERRGERDWLLVELDLDYVRAEFLPELVQRNLGNPEQSDYAVEVVAKDSPATAIYSSDPNAARIGTHADAMVGIFEVRYDQILRREAGMRGGTRGRGMTPGPDSGRWLLSVRHHAGSLEAVVAHTRYKNLAVTSAILILMLAAIAALVRYTRRAQRLADLQMEFVAGVSHELRTPLTVIRTAAHNLEGGVIHSGKQVQRYGALIANEAEKLAGMVEQVLLFSSAQRGHVLRTREVVGVEAVIEGALGACIKAVEESHCIVEKKLDPELPPVLADPTALQHALQNLVANAAKYGTDGRWIGIFASTVSGAKDTMIEIRVADRGLGIPADELGHVFDSFYRGRRAVEDQIHGTGLGLSLVKRIIEAHGGTVTVQSESGKGTEFILRIPAAPADQIDEFADTTRRG